MALMNCPECNQVVSDKAPKCPHCGYPLQSVVNVSPQDNTIISMTPSSGVPKTTKGSAKKILFIIIPIVVVLLACAVMLLFVLDTPLRVFKSQKKIEPFTLSKWTMEHDGKYSDTYKVSLNTPTKDPFLAIIGYYTDDGSYPKLVYVKDGSEEVEISVNEGEDPSTVYRPFGYINGKAVKENDYVITIKDSDYYDSSILEETNCDITVDIVFKDNRTGLFCFDITNDMNSEVMKTNIASVIDGKAHFKTGLYELPYKSRGVTVKVIPTLFCDATNLNKTTFEIDKEYSVSTDSSEYFTSYEGAETFTFNDSSFGFLLYDYKRISGGTEKDLNVYFQSYSYFKDGKGEITTYDWGDKGEIKKPEYEINPYAMVAINQF